MEKRTLFIKANRPMVGDPKLDPVVVAQNHALNIDTTLVLDTNILISMEKVVQNGNKWASVKRQGLHNLVYLLRKCPPRSIFLSPGHAFSEMPPALAEQSRKAYEIFCAVHLEGFVDTPNCIQESFRGKSSDYGFDDIPEDAQAALSTPYACLLYLNIVDRKFKGSAFEKFKAFLDYLEKDVDCLSATEIEIAKYCFWEPPASSKELIALRKKIRRNFLKTEADKVPETSDEVRTVAYNGARDIFLLHASNHLEANGLDGVEQEAWIATKDKKLSEFCSVFHHVSAGKVAASTSFPEQDESDFWAKACSEFESRVSKRLGREVVNLSLDQLREKANKAISTTDKNFA
jgi:hypothetical protein